MIITGYDWAGGREAMLRFGPPDGPVVALALPPFEEWNRTRSFAVGLLRLLAARGIGGVLPDLPALGESLVPLAEVKLVDWQSAFAAAAEGAVCTLAIRGGALFDGDAGVPARWRLAPQEGSALVRELVRIRVAAASEDGAPFDPGCIVVDGPPIAIAGNAIPRRLLRELSGAATVTSPALRTVRLEGDARPADRLVTGSPLWRRAEPDDDRALAVTLADDVAEWVRTCVG